MNLRKLRSGHFVAMLAQPVRFCHPLFLGRLGLALVFCLLALVAKSDPFSSPWSGEENDKVRMRLIAATRSGDGHYEAAAEIKLAGNAITYWRVPGDAGAPPKFSVEGSQNVAGATVFYPAPARIDEQGLEAFGYRGGVVFPIRVQARDAAKPVLLRLTVNYAVCDNICLPEKSSAELVLPRTGSSPEDGVIAEADARVPVTLLPEDVAEKVSIIADPTAANPTWLLTWKGKGPVSDLFAEAPDGWAFETHRRADGQFSLIAVEQPMSGASQQVPVRLTLTGPLKAEEFEISLQRPAKPPVASEPTVGTK